MDLTGGDQRDLTPRPEKAATAALELMKQIITLASGVLALSAAVLEKFKVSHNGVYSLLLVAWILLVVSIVAALDVISAIIKTDLTPEHRWHTGRGKAAATVSKWAFVGGLAALSMFGLVAILYPKSDESTTPSINIIDHGFDPRGTNTK